MNFKTILIENLDNMMSDLQNMKLTNNPSIQSTPKQNNNNPQNISPSNANSSVKVSVDPKTNQYNITDGTGKILATVNSKNDFAVVIDALTSHVNKP
jgi:hypothetical protein